MGCNVRVLILPGRGDSGDRHWQTFWQKRHPQFQRVQQVEWDNPDVDEWVETLHQAIVAEPSPAVLVAHSLSVSQVAHWAARHQGPVVGALLVAPTDVEAPTYPAGTRGFAPIPLQRLPFPSIVVASTDDPRVSVARARVFAEAWGSRLEVPGAFGHLGSVAELGDWPYGMGLLQSLLDEAN